VAAVRSVGRGLGPPVEPAPFCAGSGRFRRRPRGNPAPLLPDWLIRIHTESDWTAPGSDAAPSPRTRGLVGRWHPPMRGRGGQAAVQRKRVSRIRYQLVAFAYSSLTLSPRRRSRARVSEESGLLGGPNR